MTVPVVDITDTQPCALSFGNPDTDDEYQYCDQPASIQVGQLRLCPECATFLRSIGIGE